MKIIPIKTEEHIMKISKQQSVRKAAPTNECPEGTSTVHNSKY